MFKKTSIRNRLTILTAFIITLTCIGLTTVLNFSTFRAIDVIDATAISISEHDLSDGIETTPSMKAAASVEADTVKTNYQIKSSLTMLFFIIGGSTLTYVIAGRALKPLETLNNQINDMKISNLDVTLPIPKTNDEIAEITRSFNQMNVQINAAFKSQKRFGTNAAHELKTPLTVLQTKVDVFKKHRTHSIEEYEALITVFENQIHRLRDVVDSLLHMSNSEYKLEVTQINLSTLFNEIITDLSPISENKEINITLNADDITLNGDVDLLYRAFYNLIENAIKYNKSGGYVSISINKTINNQINIKIIDNGYGIPNDLKDIIFEPFYRIDESRSRSEGGSGLGLALTKEIISRHGGKITVSNHEKEDETCFDIYF